MTATNTQKGAHRRRAAWRLMGCLLALGAGACGDGAKEDATVRWYVFDEPSGAFDAAAGRCAEDGSNIEIVPLPADADQQREQLVRRLAAGDADIDVIGMDVIWTAEFARAGWILPWSDDLEARARAGRLPATVRSATYRGRLWAVPFTTNTQLLWYRTDRVQRPPATWEEMIRIAEALGEDGTIQVQGERYEGFTVFFTSLLASAGGAVLDPSGDDVSLEAGPTRKALGIMRRLATSPAADPGLATTREDQARLAFESGGSSFMVNYTFVWPSANENAPDVARVMGWARWPAVSAGRPSRVTIGGVNLGVAAHSRHPERAFRAAACLASEVNQATAAVRGGLLPSSERLYDDPAVRAAFPFADVVRKTLRDAVQRPQTPVYYDVSLAITRTLHPMSAIDPQADALRLRAAVGRALRSEGLL